MPNPKKKHPFVRGLKPAIMLKKITQKYLPRITGMYINALTVFSPQSGGSKAVKIFCTPRSGRLRPKDEEILSGFHREQLNYEGLNIQCYVKGTGPKTILLVHGWESNAARWKRLFDLLNGEEQFRVVAIDAPGHGLSGSEQFNSPLYAQFIKKACDHYHPQILIGHSIGAASIVFYLTHFEATTPEKLVLMGSPSDFKDIADTYTNMLKLNKRSVNAMMKHFKHIFEMEPEYYSIGNFAAQLDIPGAVIHDLDDPVSPFSNAEKIAGNWKGSELMPISGSGHSLNNRDVLQKLVSFIKK